MLKTSDIADVTLHVIDFNKEERDARKSRRR
jgi:hypothetical protein